MQNKFINLNRPFGKISKDTNFDEDTYSQYLNFPSFGSYSAKKWEDILKLQRVVILAEAGAGKTEEIQAAATRLREKNKKAFFLRIERLSSDFEIAFEIGNNQEFDDWLNSSNHGWFFLDSVDEAKLCGQYLRDQRSNCGIFLLTYLGKKNWQHPKTKKKLNFCELIEFLEIEGNKIISKNEKIESIKVIGIDLTKRNQPVLIK